MSPQKQAIIDVRNALFEAADGKPFGAVMQGIIMAQAKLTVACCGGDPVTAREQLARYHAMMMDAVPIYCAEIATGQSSARN